jgi:hypothetical protein
VCVCVCVCVCGGGQKLTHSLYYYWIVCVRACATVRVASFARAITLGQVPSGTGWTSLLPLTLIGSLRPGLCSCLSVTRVGFRHYHATTTLTALNRFHCCVHRASHHASIALNRFRCCVHRPCIMPEVSLSLSTSHVSPSSTLGKQRVFLCLYLSF